MDSFGTFLKELRKGDIESIRSEFLYTDLLYRAWTIIANANEGDWDKATPEWKDAAIRWRDDYHLILDEGRDKNG